MHSRRRGGGSEEDVEVVSSAAHHSVNSAALDVFLENLSVMFPKAKLQAVDLARIAAVDKRCRDAVRAAVDKRRQKIPPWVSKPWPELFCTNTFARLTPACKAETTLRESLKTVHPTTLIAARVYGRAAILKTHAN